MIMDSEFKSLASMTPEELQEKRNSVAHGIESARVELRQTQERLRAIADEEKTLKKREQQLGGAFGNSRGDIFFMEKHLETIDRFIGDQTKPKAHLTEGKRWQSDDEEWIVDKVTPKRIFLRQKGRERVDLYNHDGTPVSSYGRSIDMAKTFPNGLKVST